MGRDVKIYPVVHIQDTEQAVTQSMLALEHDADGVYLISHNQWAGSVNTAFAAVSKAAGQTAYVGVNYLDIPNPNMAYRFVQMSVDNGQLPQYPSGLWVDDALQGSDFNETAYLEELKDYRREHPDLLGVRFLGGVAFKHSSHYEDDATRAAQMAAALVPYIDVVTTSGPGTGQAPTPRKIKAMKAAIGNQDLAVASGVDVDNITSFGNSIDELLVASSIETYRYSGIFNLDRLRALVEAVHAIE